MMRNVVFSGWGAVGFALLLWALALLNLSPLFGYDFKVSEMPILPFVALLAGGGLCFCLLPHLIKSSLEISRRHRINLLGFIVVVGLAIRVILMFSEPMLEDDYQRYLWDGAQVAHGQNPYMLSPKEASASPPASVTGMLAARSGDVISRVNYSDLRSVYPPVAQIFFALSHFVAPFELIGWRIVILATDLVTLGLLLLLLGHIGRSPIWIALYWWNPVVAKEFYNSAHMDIIIAPFVLGGLYFALKGRKITPFIGLAFGVGAKIWPVFLLPLFLRHIGFARDRWRPVGIGLSLFALISGLWLAPVYIAGLDETSGFVAYAEKWQTNSAFFPNFKAALGWMFGWFGIADIWSGRIGRLIVAGALGTIALYLAKEPVGDARDLIQRCGIMVLAILLLSPAQFPWYLHWFATFLVFLPLRGVMALHVLIPLYYLGFYFMVAQEYSFFADYVAWLIWLPVWGLLISDFFNRSHWAPPSSSSQNQIRD